jgi:hypothetical protein
LGGFVPSLGELWTWEVSVWLFVLTEVMVLTLALLLVELPILPPNLG